MSPALCSHSPRASPRRGSEGGKFYLQVCMLASSENTFLLVLTNRFSARLGKKEIMDETDVVEKKCLELNRGCVSTK